MTKVVPNENLYNIAPGLEALARVNDTEDAWEGTTRGRKGEPLLICGSRKFVEAEAARLADERESGVFRVEPRGRLLADLLLADARELRDDLAEVADAVTTAARLADEEDVAGRNQAFLDALTRLQHVRQMIERSVLGGGVAIEERVAETHPHDGSGLTAEAALEQTS